MGASKRGVGIGTARPPASLRACLCMRQSESPSGVDSLESAASACASTSRSPTPRNCGNVSGPHHAPSQGCHVSHARLGAARGTRQRLPSAIKSLRPHWGPSHSRSRPFSYDISPPRVSFHRASIRSQQSDLARQIRVPHCRLDVRVLDPPLPDRSRWQGSQGVQDSLPLRYAHL